MSLEQSFYCVWSYIFLCVCACVWDPVSLSSLLNHSSFSLFSLGNRPIFTDFILFSQSLDFWFFFGFFFFFLRVISEPWGFPGGSVVKTRILSLVQNIPWSGRWQLTPVFLPGKSHGQRSLVGYSLWGHKRLELYIVTKQHQHTIVSHVFWCHSCSDRLNRENM